MTFFPRSACLQAFSTVKTNPGKEIAQLGCVPGGRRLQLGLSRIVAEAQAKAVKYRAVGFATVALACLVFALSWNQVYPPRPSDIDEYFHYANSFAAGKLPYRDYQIEYPPLAVIWFFLPRIFTASSERVQNTLPG